MSIVAPTFGSRPLNVAALRITFFLLAVTVMLFVFGLTEMTRALLKQFSSLAAQPKKCVRMQPPTPLGTMPWLLQSIAALAEVAAATPTRLTTKTITNDFMMCPSDPLAEACFRLMVTFDSFSFHGTSPELAVL